MTAKLKLVDKEPTLDITKLNRAAIEARDWSACHVAGDRSKPVELPDTKRRVWRA